MTIARRTAASLAAAAALCANAPAGEPQVTIEGLENGQVVSGQLLLQGTAAAATRVAVSIDNGPFTPADGVQSWTFLLDASTLAFAHHTITVRAREGFGPFAEVERSIIVNDQSPPTPACDSITPGALVAPDNAVAPTRLNFPAGSRIHLVIIGHSENRGYDAPLRDLLTANPPGGYDFDITNIWIGGHETYRWGAPGQQGYEAVGDVLATINGPTLALILTSNNVTYPASEPTFDDANHARFVDEMEQLADRLHADGAGVDMCFFSAHRMKPDNLMPSWYENLAVNDLLRRAEAMNKPYIKAGPEQHQLHWCCYPDCYAPDHSHTNAAGDALMAEAWYRVLDAALAPCPADLAEPTGKLDIADVVAFLQFFGVMDPRADLAAPTGVFDVADVVEFLRAFGAGCP